MVLGVVAWTAIVLVLVPQRSTDVFVVLLLIGLLVARALGGAYAEAPTNARVDVFVAIGLVVFGLMVAKRVFDVLAE